MASDPDARATRNVARMLSSRLSRMPEKLQPTARQLTAIWRDGLCTCSHASLVPGCHAAWCAYRAFWAEAAEVGSELEGHDGH